MFAGLVGWIIVGMITAFVASKTVQRRGDDPSVGLLLSVAGAVGGGLVFGAFSADGLGVFNPWSLLVALWGAGVALAVWHGVRGRLARR